MGPKPNKKGGKNVRPTLANSFIPTQPELGKEEVEKLLNLLIDKLANLYPPQISNQQVMAAINDEFVGQNDGLSFSKLPKDQRKEQFRKRRKELRHANDSLLNVNLRKDVAIGLKKCLKDLSANHLCALIFDSTVNLEPMRCIFEKGPHNGPTIIGIPKLGESIRKPLGFSAICLGFNNDIIKGQQDPTSNHFYPVLELINNLVKNGRPSPLVCDIVKIGEKNKESDPTCDILTTTNQNFNVSIESDDNSISKETKNIKADSFTFSAMPKIELLYRDDNNTRVFVPTSKISVPGGIELCDNSDFIGFSDSPDSKRLKMS